MTAVAEQIVLQQNLVCWLGREEQGAAFTTTARMRPLLLQRLTIDSLRVGAPSQAGHCVNACVWVLQQGCRPGSCQQGLRGRQTGVAVLPGQQAVLEDRHSARPLGGCTGATASSVNADSDSGPCKTCQKSTVRL